MTTPQYRFEPTDAQENAMSRLAAMIEPKQQTWDLSPNDVAALFEVHQLVRNQQIDIARLEALVDDPDTSAMVAFARMFCAFFNLDDNEPWAHKYIPLECKFERGDRSPSLAEEMTALTARMKGTTT